jgi:hypothetical protein
MKWLRSREGLTRLGVLGTLWVVGTVWFFTIDSGFGFRGPRVDGDGFYFWLHLRSLAVDGDVDFTNDYEHYGNPWNYAKTEHGKPMNPATVGSALLWAPFYLPARRLVLAADQAGAVVRTDGTSHAEELAAFYGSFIYGFLAILLALRLCRRHLPERPSLVAAVAAAVGGNLVFYMVVHPSLSHAPAAFVVAAFVERWDATRRQRSLVGWVVLGALGGLAMLVRPQLAVLALLPTVDLVRGVVGLMRGVMGPARATRGGSADGGSPDEGGAAERPAPARGPDGQDRMTAALHLVPGVLFGAGAALLVFSPQMAIWNSIHGSYFALPQGESFMQWGESLWTEVLFHPRAGLLPWMPLALPALGSC